MATTSAEMNLSTLRPPDDTGLRTTTDSYSVLRKSSQSLNIWDNFTLIICTMIMVTATFLASCQMNRGVRSFFLANRSFRFFPIACSMFMSNVGSSHFVGAAGSASRAGLSVYAYELNAVFALLILGWIFMPVYIASGSITTLDFLKKRYGGTRIELYLSGITIFLIVFARAAVELYSMYRLLEMVFGKLPFVVTCFIPLLWACLIVCGGGLQAVIYSNTVGAIVMILGASYVTHYSLSTFESYTVLREKYLQAWPNTTVLHFGDRKSNYNYTNCGLPKAKSWNLFREHFNLELPWPGMIFGLTIKSLWVFCCDQVIVQNGLGARNLVQVKSACIMVGYAKILTILLMVMPGIVARILYTDLVACADPDICEEACGSRAGCSEMAFPMLFLDVVPPGYRGLVLSAMVACGVSSLASSLNSGSTIFTLNVYRNFRPVASEMEIFFVTRTAVVAIGILSLCMVPVVQSATLLFDYMHNIEASFAPPIVAVFLCGLLWERASEESAFQALLLGLGLALTRLLWRLPYSTKNCGDEPEWPAPQIISNFHYLHFAIFLFVLCCVYIAMAGVFSEPINVVHLYRLLYWLRHSKLDRVDLNELNAAYQQLKTDNAVDDKAETVISVTEGGEDSVDAHKIISKKAEEGDGATAATAVTTSSNEQSSDYNPFQLFGQFTEQISYVCCVNDEMMENMVTDSELRETVKQRADIRETPVEEKILNMHALLLLLCSFVLWGFLS